MTIKQLVYALLYYCHSYHVPLACGIPKRYLANVLTTLTVIEELKKELEVETTTLARLLKRPYQWTFDFSDIKFYDIMHDSISFNSAVAIILYKHFELLVSFTVLILLFLYLVVLILCYLICIPAIRITAIGLMVILNAMIQDNEHAMILVD